MFGYHYTEARIKGGRNVVETDTFCTGIGTFDPEVGIEVGRMAEGQSTRQEQILFFSVCLCFRKIIKATQRQGPSPFQSGQT